jgi:hypothetical protein
MKSGLFRDRREAGRVLAEKLAAYANRPDVLEGLHVVVPVDRQHRLLLADPDALHDIAQARPGMLGEKALRAGAGGASQQTQDPSGDMRKNSIGNIGVEIRQSLFGDARLRPKSFRDV